MKVPEAVSARDPPAPVEVREVLLRTSVLDRVCGPLVDHLTGFSGSARLLRLHWAWTSCGGGDAGRWRESRRAVGPLTMYPTVISNSTISEYA